jgi:hypothetical protein
MKAACMRVDSNHISIGKQRKETTLGARRYDTELDLKEVIVGVWIGFDWLGIGTFGWSVSHKRRGIS